MQEFSFEDFATAPPASGAAPAPAGALGLAPLPGDPNPDAVMDAVAEAHAEADAIREAAHADGYAAGRQEALVTATAATQALAAATADALRATAERAEQLELDAVELALALAERIVGGALAVRPQLVLEVVRTALRGIVERERVIVLVNPADLDLVSAAMSGIQRELGGIEQLEVQAERRVQPGGAIVRHAAGEVDARVETKLERAREVIETALGDDA